MLLEFHFGFMWDHDKRKKNSRATTGTSELTVMDFFYCRFCFGRGTLSPCRPRAPGLQAPEAGMAPQPPEPVAVLSRRGQERGAAENGAPRAGPSPVRQEHTVIIEPRPGSKDEEEDAGSEPETGDPE